MAFTAEERHVGKHRQRINRRWRCLGRQGVLVANAAKGLLRPRRPKIIGDPVNDSVRGAAESRIALVSGVSERRRRCLAQNPSRTFAEILVFGGLPSELEQVVRIVVLGEHSKKDSTGSDEWRGILFPSLLQQSAPGPDGANALAIPPPPGRAREHRLIPFPPP